MGYRIKINCKKVYDNGTFYKQMSDDIIETQKRLDTISNEIYKIWGGAPGNNFIVSFNKHIKDFDAVVNFLRDNGELLRKNAYDHGNIDYEFATKMERSEFDDERNDKR